MVEKGVKFMSNTKSRMDITFDHKAPSIVVRIPQYREGYIDILKRGGTIRCITEVTLDNIGQCKELLQLVTELRHMDGMKGGIAINESEYMATTVLMEGEPLTEVIYSNAEEMVAQGKYIFDTMWKNAVSAIKKIREIEEGRPINYKTEILSRSEGSLDESELEKILYDAKEIDMIASTEGLDVGHDFFQKLVKQVREGKKILAHRGIRALVEISKNNLDLVKKYIDLNIQVRHLKKEPPIYFAVTDFNIMATIERMGYEDLAESLLYSNNPLFIKRFKLMFERLWNESRSAEEIIGLIQNDKEIPVIETIENSDKTIRLIKDLILSANDEILGILPSFDAFERQVNAGMFDHIRKVSRGKKLVIKILLTDKIKIPSGKIAVQVGKSKYHLFITRKHVEELDSRGKVYEFTTDVIENMTIRAVHQKSIRPQMGMVIVDRSKSVVVEPKESLSDNVLDYIDMSSYSNSSQISKSYATIFDTLWDYVKIFNLLEKSYEQLKTHDKMQREFIDIVAHELRTPLQSMLGLTEIVQNHTREKESRELLERVTENGARLHRFVENVIAVTKLEGFLSNTPREIFDLNSLVKDIVDNYKVRFQSMKRSTGSHTKQIHFDCQGFEQEHRVFSNKIHISMVMTDIIDNAINFVPERQKGLISITFDVKGNEVIVHFKDNGDGIHPEILHKLFTKFTTKSFYGSGLGLYICRKIINMYHGKIWAQNNPQNEKGATFSFSLPLVDSASSFDNNSSNKEG